MDRVIKFNQNVWLKSYSYINTEQKKCIKRFGKKIFKPNEQCSFWNNQSKKKLISVRTKLVHNKFFSKNLLAIEMKKTKSIVYHNIILLYY